MIARLQRLLLASTLLFIPACFTLDLADGAVKCNTGSRPCPSGFFCGGDGYCYKNGHTPPGAPSCTDGRKNGDETDTDCGGSCPPCAVGQMCSMASDCTTSLCQMSVCAMPPPQCTNGVQDPGETDKDCGGPVCPACANGKTCAMDTDCLMTMCNPTTHVCYDRCNDGVKDGDEADVDCGGSCKRKCVAPQSCGLATDCATGMCSGGFCLAASGPPNWIKVATYPAGFNQFWNQSVVGPDGKIYLIGGCFGPSPTDLLTNANCGAVSAPSYVYDAAANTLTTGITISTGSESRATGAAALVGSKVYLLGGYTASDPSNISTWMAVTQVDAYDFSTKTWTQNVATLPSGNQLIEWGMAVPGPNSDIFFFGGRYQGGQSPYLSEFWDFSTTTAMFDTTTRRLIRRCLIASLPPAQPYLAMEIFTCSWVNATATAARRLPI